MLKQSKKLSISLLTAAALSVSANAGVLLDAEVGAGMWNPAPSGTINYGESIDLEKDLGLDSSTNGYLYAQFDHFIPIIPNVRVEQQSLTLDSTYNLSSVDFGTESFSGDTNIKLDLTQQDLVLYWGIPGLNLLTIGMFDVDFGIDVKKFSGSISLDDEVADLDFIVPMGYLAAKVDLPYIPLIRASYKTITYKDSSISDAMVKMSFDLPIPIPLIDIRADLGYKTQSIVLDTDLSDSLSTDITFSGVFFGINAKF
jgi:outer membrane protein